MNRGHTRPFLGVPSRPAAPAVMVDEFHVRWAAKAAELLCTCVGWCHWKAGLCFYFNSPTWHEASTGRAQI